ncbi:MAG: lactate utilization protein [Dechloromonas sp.]|nr:lactate utilization protein [Dechloromonas sp.]
MSARDRILAKLRQNAPSTANALPDVATWFATHRPVESMTDKAKRFHHVIELAHAEVHAVNADTWTGKLHEVLKARGIEKLLVAEGTPHGDAALDDLPPRGIDCSVYEMAIEAWQSELFDDTPASLTAARAAIAETGTLILWPDALEPRLMSLVPPVHVVLLDASNIHNTFYEAMTAEGWSSGLPTNALLISGPSKTADIQQTLAYGAHGPKELIVLMLGAPEGAAQ